VSIIFSPRNVTFTDFRSGQNGTPRYKSPRPSLAKYRVCDSNAPAVGRLGTAFVLSRRNHKLVSLSFVNL